MAEGPHPRGRHLRTPQPPPTQLATPPQNTTAPAAGSKLGYKESLDIFRGVFGHGLSGFPHTLQQFKGTNSMADAGCAGCGSREHNYAECPAQNMTKKEARNILLDLGRRPANAHALAAAGTSVTEFAAAVERVYN